MKIIITLAIIGVITLPLSMFFYSRIKYLGKYSIFLENEYYHFYKQIEKL